MLASDNGHYECVKELVDKGAQVNIQDGVSLYNIPSPPTSSPGQLPNYQTLELSFTCNSPLSCCT